MSQPTKFELLELSRALDDMAGRVSSPGFAAWLADARQAVSEAASSAESGLEPPEDVKRWTALYEHGVASLIEQLSKQYPKLYAAAEAYHQKAEGVLSEVSSFRFPVPVDASLLPPMTSVEFQLLRSFGGVKQNS